MVRAGMDVARLNFSHGTQAHHAEDIERVRAIADQVGRPIAILGDLQGPKLRVGRVQGEGVLLEPGQKLVLTTHEIVGRPGLIPVQYQELPAAVKPGDRILLDDGLIELQVRGTGKGEITADVIVGGLLQSNKGMNLPNASFAIPAITEKDRDDLRFMLEHGVDWVALSFVRTAAEVEELRELIRKASLANHITPIIAKIEKPEAVHNIDSIIEAVDGIMVARGDLGIETAPETVPLVQKLIIAKCNTAGKPVITATQMLDSMIRNPRPTRAEATDVANAILDGTDAVMLSGETAIGKYPLRSLQTMVRIVEEAEKARHQGIACPPPPPRPKAVTIAEAVSRATCQTAEDLNATAIITPTVSGYTACMVSRYRPICPIIAITPDPRVQRQLMLRWGVQPLLSHRRASSDAVIEDAVAVAREYGYVQEGDVVVVTAGAAGSAPGTTDLMKVHVVTSPVE